MALHFLLRAAVDAGSLERVGDLSGERFDPPQLFSNFQKKFLVLYKLADCTRQDQGTLRSIVMRTVCSGEAKRR